MEHALTHTNMHTHIHTRMNGYTYTLMYTHGINRNDDNRNKYIENN